MELIYNDFFDLTDRYKRSARCHLLIYAPHGGNLPIVIATEVNDNGGFSITNDVESYYTQVWKRFFPKERRGLVWVEHYIRDLLKPKETFAFVTLTLADKPFAVKTPAWRHVTRSIVEERLGQPLPPLLITSY